MSDATIDVLLNEPIAAIHPNLYGHFMEHLGGCIEEGCWVGEDSAIAHTGGIRNDIVAALKTVRAPVIRWPGGCFADDYHWQDGIGPRDQRPRRVNMHWGEVIETNQFGTHEFLAFCRAVGAQPYLCGNVGSGTPRELRDWVEYCNFPGDSTLARQRAANGAPEPFGVHYWGVGNENWGCGGNFTPEDYGTEYRRFATYLRAWGGQELTLIACGPNGNDLDWTRRFFTKLRKDFWSGPPIHGFSAHYYCGTAGTATEYTEAQWYELLWKAIQMEPMVVQQRALLDAFDPERKIGLIVDEWGTWHPPTPGRNPAFLWQQNTVRDALVAALTLDIFNRHADKVVMANIAQTINVLQALLLTDGEKMLKTPTYHVYALYTAHQGAQSVRAHFQAPEIEVARDGKARKLPTLSGSASVTKNTLTLTVVNTSATQQIEAGLRLHGGAHATEIQVSTLAYPDGDIHAHNTHAAPDAVSVSALRSVPVPIRAYTFPPASVTRLTLTLD
jgi:alpha-N-arabinofuranosidase